MLSQLAKRSKTAVCFLVISNLALSVESFLKNSGDDIINKRPLD